MGMKTKMRSSSEHSRLLHKSSTLRVHKKVGKGRERGSAGAAFGPTKDHFRDVFENSTDAIILVDGAGRIIEYNQAGETISGIPRRQALGMYVWEYQFTLFPPSSQTDEALQNIKMRVTAALKTGRLRQPEQGMEALVCRADGQMRWVLQKFFIIPSRQGFRMAGIFRDITEYRRYEAFMHILHDLNIILNTATELDKAIACILEAACQLEPVDSGGIYLVNQQTGEVSIVAHQGLSETFVKQVMHFSADSPPAHLYQKGQPVYSSVRDADLPNPAFLFEEKLQSIAVIPIVFEGKMLAGMNLASHTAEEIPENTRTLLETLAARVGGALDRIQTIQALRASEKNFRAIFDMAPLAIAVLEEEGDIVRLWNPAAERVFGWRAAEVLGKEVPVVPPERLDESQRIKQENMQNNEMVGFEALCQRKDGTRITVLLSTARLYDAEGKAVHMIIYEDISGRKQTEEALRQSEETFRNFAEQNSEGIMLIDEQGTILIWNQALERITGISREEAIGRYNWVVQLQMLLPENQTPEKLEALKRLTLDALHTGAIQDSPVMFTIWRKDGAAVTIYQTAFTIHTSSGIRIGAVTRDITEVMRFQQEIQALNDQLLKAYDATIEGWANALELRDQETTGHSRRVVEWTIKLARQMNVAEEMLEHLRRGAILHDIGKMGIPDTILLKNGPLTEDEWVVMRQHPGYAYRLLSNIPFLEPATDIPYCHHERWDGAGYPRGLRGEEIPLAARIFTVIDVWDALSSDRPYRRAWPAEEVMRYLRDNAGSYFDARVVEQFFVCYYGG